MNTWQMEIEIEIRSKLPDLQSPYTLTHTYICVYIYIYTHTRMQVAPLHAEVKALLQMSCAV